MFFIYNAITGKFNISYVIHSTFLLDRVLVQNKHYVIYKKICNIESISRFLKPSD